MKSVFLFLSSLFFVLTGEASAQNSTRPTARQNCAYVGRPIIDVAGGFVIGKSLRLPKPRISRKAKKSVQNTSVTVKIKVDKSGEVILAKSESRNPLIHLPLEQAALKSKFTPTTSAGQRVTVEMELIYHFEKETIRIEVLPIWKSIEDKSEPIDPNSFILLKMFDSKILDVIEKSRFETINNFGDFVVNGRASIQICLSEKTPEVVDRIKQKGFELLEESQGNGLVGKIAVVNLEKLKEIEELRRVLPEIQ